MKQKRAWNPQTTLLLSPWMATFLVFWLFPLLYALYMSFTRYLTLRNEAIWIGADNYIRIFSDELFWTALSNTSVFVFGTIPITTAFALLLAVAVNNIKRFQTFFRSAFFLPSVTSLVVLSLIFTNLFAKEGYLNLLLGMLGLPFPRARLVVGTGYGAFCNYGHGNLDFSRILYGDFSGCLADYSERLLRSCRTCWCTCLDAIDPNYAALASTNPVVCASHQHNKVVSGFR